MPIDIEQLRTELDVDEPNYRRVAARLGVEAMPLLAELAVGSDKGLAAKAIYLASLISPDHATEILQQAARSPDPMIRLTAAAAASNVPSLDASPILLGLVEDHDRGVRKAALGAVGGQVSSALRDRLQELSEASDPSLQRMAREAMARVAN
jgi:HEAT repeat protein